MIVYIIAALLVFGILIAVHEPVSYTHLDVYKRQAWPCNILCTKVS